MDKNKLEYTIRAMEATEQGVLREMLYEALYQKEGCDPFPRDIVDQPEISIYIADFGKRDDYCLVAAFGTKIIGAVWVRILAGERRGFGNIDAQTPECAIALLKEYRNQGVGTSLMKEMIKHLQRNGYTQTSLSVNKDNYAVRMYEKVGFSMVAEREHDYLMLLKLA